MITFLFGLIIGVSKLQGKSKMVSTIQNQPTISASNSLRTPTPGKLSIETFYNVRKTFVDNNGNILNKDKYPFLNVLSTYLNDIVTSIDIEIKNSSRHSSVINWREKKNPKLLSKLINTDDNINVINRSINKITGSNYLDIVTEINKIFTTNNSNGKYGEYTKYIFDSIIKKCIIEEMFCKDYMLFLTAFKDVVAKGINDSIGDFAGEVKKIMGGNNANIVDFPFHSSIKDVAQYRNIGMIFGNIYLLNVNGSSTHLNISNNELISMIVSNIENINTFLDWLPVNMDELHGRIYLMVGILETIAKHLYYYVSNDDKEKINDVLNTVYNFKGMPNKIKFKVLDLQDIIKGIMTMKHNVPIEVETQRIAESMKTNLNIENNNNSIQNINNPISMNSSSTNSSSANSSSTNKTIVDDGDKVSKPQENKKKTVKRVEYQNNYKTKVINRDEKKNIFEILRNHDSSDKEDSNNDDDGFIKIERRSKKSPPSTPSVEYNVYKPKKTAEIAKDGGSIYNSSNQRRNKKM